MRKSLFSCHIGAFIGFLILGLAFAEPTTAADEMEKVVLQLKWHHQFQFAGYYAARMKGYYREEGLDVEFREGENVDTVQQVISGEADFGIALSDLVLSYMNEEPVVALATIFQHSPLVLIRKEGSASESIHDLDGSRVMLETHSEELVAYLTEMGMEEKDFILFPYKDAMQSLLNGNVDAISAYITDEPFQLSQKNFFYQMTSPRAVGIDFYGDTLFTSRKVISENDGKVQKFRRASLKGWKYALDHPDEMISYILQNWPEGNSREALQYEAEQIQKLVRDDLIEIGYMNPGRWQHIADVYADLGIASRNVDLQRFIYTSRQPIPWGKILLFTTPLICLLLLVSFIAFYQHKHRRIQTETLGKLQVLERKMSTLLTNMPGIAYRCHNDGKDWKMEYISHGSLELTGYTPDELIDAEGPVFGDLIHPDDALIVSEKVANATSEKRKFRLEYRIRHVDGTIRWVWEQGMLVNDEMLEGFICDITEQKQYQEEKDLAYKESQDLLDELKVLRGIIPICSSCKNIRNDQGAWQQMEAYIKAHTKAEFSHGICPDCMKRLYPGYIESLSETTGTQQSEDSQPREDGSN